MSKGIPKPAMLYIGVLESFGFHVHTGGPHAPLDSARTGLRPIHDRWEYLRILWREICSLRARMEIVRKNKLHRRGIPLVFPSEWSSATPNETLGGYHDDA